MTDASQDPAKELAARKLGDLKDRKNKQNTHALFFMIASIGLGFIALQNHPASESDLQKQFKKEAIGAQAAALAETAANTTGQKKLMVEIDLEKADNDASVKAKQTVVEITERQKGSKKMGWLYTGLTGAYSLLCLYEARKLKSQIKTLETPAPV